MKRRHICDMRGCRAFAVPVGLLLCAGLLSGCGGSARPSPTSSYPTSSVPLVAPTPSSSSTQAQAGSVRSRDGSFSAVLPDSWGTVKSSVTGMMLFERAPSATHGIRTNFNVLRQGAAGASLTDAVSQATASLQQSGWAVTAGPGLTVGGIPAKSVMATTAAQGKKISVHQYYILKGTSVYIATMTSSPSDAPAAQKTATAIFASWAWSSS
ncbi:hypothetical protein V3G39_15745 [Dermatophilaceae bacterium Sec6.4]